MTGVRCPFCDGAVVDSEQSSETDRGVTFDVTCENNHRGSLTWPKVPNEVEC